MEEHQSSPWSKRPSRAWSSDGSGRVNDERPWPVASRPRKANCKKPYRIRYGSMMSCAAARDFERRRDHLAKFSGEAAYGLGLLCRSNARANDYLWGCGPSALGAQKTAAALGVREDGNT